MQHTLPAPSCFRLEGTREAAHVVLERTFVPQELHVGTIHPYATLLALGDVLVASQRCEAPVFADDNLLTAGELVLSAAESFDGGSTVCGVIWSARSPAACMNKMYLRESRVRTERMIWPMLTRATVPLGLPKAPRMPVCSLSAPAHDNILLIRITWYG